MISKLQMQLIKNTQSWFGCSKGITDEVFFEWQLESKGSA